ncbi:hypothetical protein PInf_011886 [Phytophthora infestans]|nr:hypothetical protein PInf_011886 [Phytophthora infestans]
MTATIARVRRGLVAASAALHAKVPVVGSASFYDHTFHVRDKSRLEKFETDQNGVLANAKR